MIFTGTNFSPFKLLYGEEAMTLKEIRLSSWRIESVPFEVGADMNVTLNTTEALRDQAVVNLTSYQDNTHHWRNKKFKPRGI